MDTSHGHVLDEQFLLCFVFSRFMDEASHDTYVYNTPRCRVTMICIP